MSLASTPSVTSPSALLGLLGLIGRDGVFSSADAARRGLDRHALSRLCDRGEVLRLSRGWFTVLGPEPPSRERRHLLTALALGRQFRSRAAISHHSLLICRELPTYRADLSTVHLTSVVDDTASGSSAGGRRSVSVRRDGLVIHRSVSGVRLPPEGSNDRPGAMPLAHAIVQAGLLAGPEAALVPADAALRLGRVSPGDLAASVAAFGSHRGIGPVRAALPLADAGHESPGESRTAFVLDCLGYDLEPQLEVVVEGRRYRADFRIRGTRVLVEFDGAVKYADGDRRVLFDEKRREDALRRAGWVVVRLVWADLDDPARVRGLVAEALACAA
ncbi:MAG: type IV toxin-antitoxin system AbiEi family antitoxin domain-containing protein [Humibacillus sp.]|nr:type IV toxin-antitoxin system AbiEi family antitoxin domain-containing protein [Humibacillus sp.]MDN5779879.1 type IV toxin-antitoxin system AbiEi family antitoxin domain-containing protein [Humibacillus sp.]